MANPRLFHPEKKPFEHLTGVGFAVQCGPPRSAVDPPMRHVGILFRRASGAAGSRVRLLHLAWHCKLIEQSPDRDYSWLELSIPEERIPLIAELCRLLIEKYGGDSGAPIFYALKYDGRGFDPDGHFPSDPGQGLTCATFVLAVFKSCGVPLLRTEEWLPRDDDRTWQEWIIATLRRTRRATAAHVEAVRNDIGCTRFRPQEVAAAGAVDDLPVGFQEAERLGEEIVQALLARHEPRQ